MRRVCVLVFLMALFTAGCATVPDVTVSYYFPRAETVFTVTQTVGCSPKIKDTHRLIRSVISIAPVTTNTADTAWLVDQKVRQGSLHYKDFRGTFSDSDVTVTLTPDGRLSGINATSAGQGDAVVKDLITVAGAVALFGGALPKLVVKNVEDVACDKVDDFSVALQTGPVDPSKTVPALVTLTYSVAVRYDVTNKEPGLIVDQDLSPGYPVGPQNSLVLIPDPVVKPIYEELQKILGSRMETRLVLRSDAVTLQYLRTTSPTTFTSSKLVKLELNDVALLRLAVTGHVADLTSETQIWAGSIPAPLHSTYQLPIPMPAIFGKTAFGIALSDYGSITSLHYGSNSGAPDTADAMGALTTALKPKSAEDRSKDIQGQADLIAQQQRLIVCQTTPKQCK